MSSFSSIRDEDFNIFHTYDGLTASTSDRTIWGEQPQLYYEVRPWHGSFAPTGAQFDFTVPGSGDSGADLPMIFAANRQRRGVAAPLSIFGRGCLAYTRDPTTNEYDTTSSFIDHVNAYVCGRVPATRRVRAYFGLHKVYGSPRYPQLAQGVLIGVQRNVGTFATVSQSYVQHAYTHSLSCFCVIVDRDRRLDGGTRKAYLIQVIAGTATVRDSVEIATPTAVIGGQGSPGAMQVDYIDCLHGNTQTTASVVMKDGTAYTLTTSYSSTYGNAGLAGVILSPIKRDSQYQDAANDQNDPGYDRVNNTTYGPCVTRIIYTDDDAGSLGDEHIDDLTRDFGSTLGLSTHNTGNQDAGSSDGFARQNKNKYFSLQTIGFGTRHGCGLIQDPAPSGVDAEDGIHTPSSPTAAITKLEIGDKQAFGPSLVFTDNRRAYGSLCSSLTIATEQQRRSTEITMNSGSARNIAAGIVLRQSLTRDRGQPDSAGVLQNPALWYRVLNQFLVSDGVATFPYQRGYACVVEYDFSMTTHTLKVYSYFSDQSVTQTHTRTELASATLSGLTVGTAFTLEFEAQNTESSFGAGSEFVRLRAVVDGTEITSYTIPTVLSDTNSVSQGSLGGNYWLVDQRSNANVAPGTTGVVAFSLTETGLPESNGKMAEFSYFNTLTPSAAVDSGTEPTFGDSIAVASEDAAATGTLTLDYSFGVTEVTQRLRNEQDIETGHKYVFARQTKSRRRFQVQALNTTPAARAALLTFYADHNGAEIPFSWSPTVTSPAQSPETLTVRFVTQDLSRTLSDPSVESFTFELEEVFDGS